MKVKLKSIVYLKVLSAVISSYFSLISATMVAVVFIVSPGFLYASGGDIDAYFFLKSKRENERIAALKMFIDAQAESAVPRIIKLLDDPSTQVRKQAALALLSLGHPADRISVPALIERISRETDMETLETLIFALASFSEDDNAVMTLREVFKKVSREQQYRILDAMHPLIKTHRRAFSNLFEIVYYSALSSDELLRLHAAVAAGEFGDAQYALGLFLRLIKDSNADIRLCVCRYLGIMKPFEALEPLINAAMKDVSPAVRKEAVTAVSNYNHPETFVFFKNVLLNDLDGEARGAAALAMIGLKDRRAVPLLKTALLDSANIVRLNSAYALVFFGEYCAQEELVWFLWEQNLPEYRRRAAHGLANIKSRSVLDDLERALKDWDDEVREIAFEALRRRWGYRITQ